MEENTNLSIQILKIIPKIITGKATIKTGEVNDHFAKISFQKNEKECFIKIFKIGQNLFTLTIKTEKISIHIEKKTSKEMTTLLNLKGKEESFINIADESIRNKILKTMF